MQGIGGTQGKARRHEGKRGIQAGMPGGRYGNTGSGQGKAGMEINACRLAGQRIEELRARHKHMEANQPAGWVKQAGTLDREGKQAGESKEGREGSVLQIARRTIRWEKAGWQVGRSRW